MSTECLLKAGLKLVKRSPLYRMLHHELRSPLPADSWHEGSWVFCVFDLQPPDGESGAVCQRMALFAANVARHTIESVKLIVTRAGSDYAEVADLALPGAPQSLPLPRGWHASVAEAASTP